MVDNRPSWDEYFMDIVDAVSKRGTCDRGQAGCVIVREKRILTTGYVGSPPGLPHCDEVGHQMHAVTHEDGTVSQHCIRTTHAEQNAMIQAAKHGISLEGATIYTKMTPCYVCAKLIITAGIKRVVALRDYHAAKESKDILTRADVKVDILNKEVEAYKNQ